MMALEYVILIVPGETTLTTAGVLAHSGSIHLNFIGMVLVTGLGTFFGAMFAYAIGRLFGRPLLVRYGKYIFLTPKRLQRGEALFGRYTILTLAVSRYIAVARDVIPYIAGIQRVKLIVFVPVILLSSFLWTASFLLAGGLLAEAWKTVSIHWRTELIPALLIAAALGVGYWYLHRKLSALGTKSTADVDANPVTGERKHHDIEA